MNFCKFLSVFPLLLAASSVRADIQALTAPAPDSGEREALNTFSTDATFRKKPHRPTHPKPTPPSPAPVPPPAPQPPPPPNAFQRIQGLYDAAQTPAAETDLLGWYSGRCFLTSTPDHAVNGLIVGFRDSDSPRGGPLFPGSDKLKVLSMWYATNGQDGWPEDFFDDMDADKERRIADFLDSENGKPTVAEARVADNALLATQKVSNGPQWFLRKSGDYVVEKFVQNQRVQAYCYYFKKVK